jgi:cellulose synthase/poly-beta-1,6-N-acetylglucosamine synthase-like glycosyltransferase
VNDWISGILHAVDVTVIYYFFFLNGIYLLLSLVAFREIYQHLLRNIYGGFESLAHSPLTPPVSIVVPAYNEEVCIGLTANNLLHLDYMRYEVIIVNDGSTDRTLEELRRQFRLVPAPTPPETSLKTSPVRAVYRSELHHNLIVVDKDNGGKADALNAGLALARHPFFCSIDADAVLEHDALQRVIRPIMESPVRVIGVGGIIRVSNGCRVEKGRITKIDLSLSPLPVFQVVEYFRAFLCGRTGFSRFNALLIVSGAFAVFERDLVLAIGGYRKETVGEDMDLVTRLHAYMREHDLHDYRIDFVPDPVCWTEVPSSLRVLSRQRRRWQKGLLEVLSENTRLLFNPRYRGLGLFAYPFFLIFEGWGIVLEVLGYIVFLLGWWFNALEPDFMLAFLAVAILCGTMLSLTGVLLGEMTPRSYPKARQWLRLIAYAVIENFGYRQLISVLRLLGTLDFIRRRGEWGRMERRGMAEQR